MNRARLNSILCLAWVLVATPSCDKSESSSASKVASPDKKPRAGAEASKDDEQPKQGDSQPSPTAAELSKPVKLDAPPPLADGAERWQGVIDLGMRKIEVLVDFAMSKGNTWTATLGLPASKIYKIGLRDVSYTPETIGFTLFKPAAPKASEIYELAPDGKGGAQGKVTISGQPFPFSAHKLKSGAKVQRLIKRPQTPKPPYPYVMRELTFTNPNDGVKRAGVLSIPKGKRRHPVVIIESGSGPHDRDGTFADHKGYLVIGDYLARHGIATLRTDDRGVGKSTGVDADAGHETLTGDVLAMVKVLKEQPELDATKIGVVGHSQGAIVAPMAAAQTKDVAFVVMLAGIGVPGDQVMMDQKRLIVQSQGVSGERLAAIMAHQRTMLDLILADADAAAIRKAVERGLEVDLTAEQLAQVTPELRKQLIDSGVRSMQAGFMRALVKAKPASFLEKVMVPILAVWGMKDLQVEPMSNSAGFKKAILASGNKDAEIWLVPRMSHNLQETDTGKVEELGSIEETVRPVLLKKLVVWIGAKTGLLPIHGGAGPAAAPKPR